MTFNAIQVRRDLHQIPELGFKEYKTQRYLLDIIEALPQERIEVEMWRTGILVKVNGTSPNGRCIGYRADMDGLPIEEETGLPFASTHSGQMHACGHDMHMTIALGLLTKVVNQPIGDTMLFLFQPAEEGPGGAAPMMASDAFRRWLPEEIYALHIAPQFPVGTVALKSGLLFANTSELFITLKGKGGHAAYPHQTHDMVVAASYLITQLQTVVSRRVDPMDHAVLSIGKLQAGNVQNVIAETARIEGTMRTMSPEAMDAFKKEVEGHVKAIELAFHCQATIDFGANYYQVENNDEVATTLIRHFKQSTTLRFLECEAAMTGEDFGYMTKEIPGCLFWLGVGPTEGLHSSKIIPDEAALDLAIQELYRYFSSK
ncbi:N-acetyldiaminopimelate deacetylase [Aureibacillus halotolerans]|uniref:N-acetyldiaminopimelate deacetylase n=1 Tax=Aureibacillus halotolerans TaxID=1508390 RepID=A0A4R6U6V8_9BACI|nr:N-acetyldiaminopimelate deacetylase [Aureibacillus halotolerans]TDQ42248.1 N-acetyldiaminopimelate deacetylase [Aureibacillus halotolerans]